MSENIYIRIQITVAEKEKSYYIGSDPKGEAEILFKLPGNALFPPAIDIQNLVVMAFSQYQQEANPAPEVEQVEE